MHGVIMAQIVDLFHTIFQNELKYMLTSLLRMQAYLCLPNLFPIVDTARSRVAVTLLLCCFVKTIPFLLSYSRSILHLALGYKAKAETRKCG